jgi:predicted nucleotidyltransferase
MKKSSDPFFQIIITKDQILLLLHELDKGLRAKNLEGELFLVGGAVMCLVFNSRESTRDVDAIFAPENELSVIADEIASAHSLPADWLNDGVKGFISDSATFNDFLNLPNLKVSVASPEYLLAMKCLSCRTSDERDILDIKTLIKVLKLDHFDDVIKEIVRFYPEKMFPPRVKFILEEILEERKNDLS